MPFIDEQPNTPHDLTNIPPASDKLLQGMYRAGQKAQKDAETKHVEQIWAKVRYDNDHPKSQKLEFSLVGMAALLIVVAVIQFIHSRRKAIASAANKVAKTTEMAAIGGAASIVSAKRRFVQKVEDRIASRDH